MNKTTHRLKIIDLGSACSEKHFPFQYIQSRYYRSPEVMLGVPLTSAIDMWSFGCILLELYLGIPIFPGTSGYDQLLKIFEILGLPPQEIIHSSTNKNKYFVQDSTGYRYKSVAEFEKETKAKLPEIKRYHNLRSLSDIKKIYRKSHLRQKASAKDEARLEEFYDLLKRILVIDPSQRLNVDEAISHPFFKRVGTTKEKKTHKEKDGNPLPPLTTTDSPMDGDNLKNASTTKANANFKISSSSGKLPTIK